MNWPRSKAKNWDQTPQASVLSVCRSTPDLVPPLAKVGVFCFLLISNVGRGSCKELLTFVFPDYPLRIYTHGA